MSHIISRYRLNIHRYNVKQIRVIILHVHNIHIIFFISISCEYTAALVEAVAYPPPETMVAEVLNMNGGLEEYIQSTFST